MPANPFEVSMDRRAYLAATATVLLAGCSTNGGDPSETEDPWYVTEPEGSVFSSIASVDGLTRALSAATDGDLVAVNPDAELDLDGLWEITVPSGVTLAGSHEEGNPGAVLRSADGDQTPESEPFTRKLELGQGARITGFRLEGNYHEYVNPDEEHDGDYNAHRGGGGVTAEEDTEVDNNEISGWPYAGVVAHGNSHVHDNYIHHNVWEGLGYGVTVPEGDHMPLIESNRFDYNRHSIAGGGGERTGYIAKHNLVEERAVGHQFEMHGSEGMSGVAGRRIVIEQNTFKATRNVEEKTRDPGGRAHAIDIRGTPTEGAWIERNWFYHDDRESAVRQPERYENVHFTDNHFGTADPPTLDIGASKSR